MAEGLQEQLQKLYAPAVENRLGRLPSRDQLPVGSWLIQTPVGTNYALQILEALEDLARKEEKSPQQILHGTLSEIEDIKLQPKEMGRKVRDLLFHRLHPRSGDHWERFQGFVMGLDLPAGIQLKPPQNFEGTHFQLQLTFKDLEELETQLRALHESLQKSEWQYLKEF